MSVRKSLADRERRGEQVSTLRKTWLASRAQLGIVLIKVVSSAFV